MRVLVWHGLRGCLCLPGPVCGRRGVDEGVRGEKDIPRIAVAVRRGGKGSA